MELPIYGVSRDILSGLYQHSTLIVVGATGCGKTTQVPQMLYDFGFACQRSELIAAPSPFDSILDSDSDGAASEGLTLPTSQTSPSRCVIPAGHYQIYCTQPRRVAATSVALRVASELGSPIGNTVGYRVRFEQKQSSATRILFCTDGMLLRDFTDTPALDAVQCVVVDEAHERAAPTDLVLALLRLVAARRAEAWAKVMQRASIPNLGRVPFETFCASSDSALRSRTSTHSVARGRMGARRASPSLLYTQEAITAAAAAGVSLPLKIIVASATMDPHRFAAFFSIPKACGGLRGSGTGGGGVGGGEVTDDVVAHATSAGDGGASATSAAFRKDEKAFSVVECDGALTAAAEGGEGTGRFDSVPQPRGGYVAEADTEGVGASCASDKVPCDIQRSLRGDERESNLTATTTPRTLPPRFSFGTRGRRGGGVGRLVARGVKGVSDGSSAKRNDPVAPPFCDGGGRRSDDVEALAAAFSAHDALPDTAPARTPLTFIPEKNDQSTPQTHSGALKAPNTPSGAKVAEDPLAPLHAGDAAAAADAKRALYASLEAAGEVPAPVVVAEGRRYGVDIRFANEAPDDYMAAVVETVRKINADPREGDVLVFLTGQEDIECVAEQLREASNRAPPAGQSTTRVGVNVAEGTIGGAVAAVGGGAAPSVTAEGGGEGEVLKTLLVLPIYGALPTEQQQRVFEKTPAGSRKIVLATNIAETSLTIDGIVFVIDCGFAKTLTVDPRTGVRALTATLISRANAAQRTGRAGRTAPGVCYRLYTQWTFANEMPSLPTPDLLTCDVVPVVLSLFALGVRQPQSLKLVDPFPDGAVAKAIFDLQGMGLLRQKGGLSKLGSAVARLPLDPPLACTLLAAVAIGPRATKLVLTLVSVLSAGGAVFVFPHGRHAYASKAHSLFWSGGGDHLTLVTVFERWWDSGAKPSYATEHCLHHQTLKRAVSIRHQLMKMTVDAATRLFGNASGDAGGFGSFSRAQFREWELPPPSSAGHDDVADATVSTSYASRALLRNAVDEVDRGMGEGSGEGVLVVSHDGAPSQVYSVPTLPSASLDATAPRDELVGRALAAGYVLNIARYAPGADAERVDVGEGPTSAPLRRPRDDPPAPLFSETFGGAVVSSSTGGSADRALSGRGVGGDGAKGLLVYRVLPGGAYVGVAAGSHLFRCEPTPPLVVFHETVTNRRGRVVMRTVSGIDRGWIPPSAAAIHSGTSLRTKRAPPTAPSRQMKQLMDAARR